MSWTEPRFWAALRSDRPLLIATVALVLLAWAPLAVTPFLPLQDLPAHVGLASALGQVARGAGELGARYQIDWSPLPYWTGVLLMAAVQAVLGPLLGAKVVVGLVVALVPLATMRLLIALDRSPRLGLWAFALSWPYSLYFGWISFLLGVGLALWLLALTVEATTARAQLRLVPLGVLLGLTHVLAASFFLVQLAGLMALGEGTWRERCRRAWPGLGVVAALVPWVVKLLTGRASGRPFAAEWDRPGDKLAGLFRDSLDTLPDGGWTGAGCVLVILLGPALLALAPSRPGPIESRHDRSAATLAVLGLLLYLALPRNVLAPVDHWGTGSRFAAVAVLGWLLLPRPALDGRRALALVPGVVLTVAHLVAVTRQFHRFGVEVAPLVRVIEAAPPARRLLPLVFDNGRPLVPHHRPMNQLHAYLAARQGSFDPFYFDSPGLHPVQFRAEGRPAAPPWFAPAQFSFERHGQLYDQVLVQGLARDPLAGDPRAHLVIEAGVWRLYTVERPTTGP